MYQYLLKNFETNGGVLSYVEGEPNGEPIILIHGVGSRWQPFQPIMPALIKNFHVFALDLRGHGKSSHTQTTYRLGDYTCDIYEFVIHQVHQPAVIYGHSLGALIAINLAAQHPQSVRKLILGDPPLYYHDTAIQETFWQKAFQELLDFMLTYPDPDLMMATLIPNWPNMPPERREERVRSLETLDPNVIRAIISDDLMKGVSLTDLSSQVVCPVLLLQGNSSLGSALREVDITFAMTHFQNIQHLKMETVGHGIIPVSMLTDLIAFVREK